MTAHTRDVLVYGAGVSGLTTGIRLAERGHRVTVLAPETTQTSSYAAGALWGPVLTTDERVLRWSGVTLAELDRIRAEAGEFLSGIRQVTGVEAAKTPTDPPVYLNQLTDFAMLAPADLPEEYVCGWRYTAPMLDMPVYLRYLDDRLRKIGGRVEQRAVASLRDFPPPWTVAVNCTGSAAKELVPDADIEPVRGMLVVVENPGIDEFFAAAVEHDVVDMTYLLPHGDRVVLGGLAEREVDRDPAEPRPSDEDIAQAIIDRCVAIEPKLAGAKVIDRRVGWRPTRSSIRLECEDLGDRWLIHNYGHGGGGVSVSWGCADEVATIVDRIARRPAG